MAKAVEDLFTLYYKDIYGYLFHLSRDACLAEDLASEVFLEAVRSAAAFRGESDVKTWLFSIARHRWFHYLRSKSRAPETQALTEFVEARGPGVEQLCQDRDLLQRIRRLLEAEPERTQRVVLLRIDGLSFYEIGRAVGISEASARVIDFRAKAKIRDALKKEGLYDD